MKEIIKSITVLLSKKTFGVLMLLFLIGSITSGQAQKVKTKDTSTYTVSAKRKSKNFSFDFEGKDALKLNSKWKYHPGDSAQWADSSFNEGKWNSRNTWLNTDSLTLREFPGIAWFRLRFDVDSLLKDKPLALVMDQEGASEIYLDGKLIHSFGTPSTDPLKEIRKNPHEMPISFSLDPTRKHVLAVRYSNHKAFSDQKRYGQESPGFLLKIVGLDIALYRYKLFYLWLSSVLVFLSGSLLAFGFFHLILFVFYHREKSNVYYSAFSIMAGLTMLISFLSSHYPEPDWVNRMNFFTTLSFPSVFVALQGLLYSFFRSSMPKAFWLTLTALAAAVLISFFNFNWGDTLSGFVTFFAATDSLRLATREGIGAIKRMRYAKNFGRIAVLLFGIFCVLAVLGFFISGLSFAKKIPVGIIVMVLILLVVVIFGGLFFIPFIMLVRHARSFSSTNKNLELQLEQVQLLSAKTLQQEQEKQRILETQNENLEIIVSERTAELKLKNKDITDSINYAQRIQRAILPSTELIYKTLQDAFVLFKPKDVVSGDFYAFAERDDKIILAAADCTGHGVPGALMSMVGTNLLNQIIVENGITDPAIILTQLHKGVRTALKQNESGSLENRDGMDISLCCINSERNEMVFAGAQRPLFLIRNNDLIEIKGDKLSIGGHNSGEQDFTNHTLKLEKGDTFFMSSDGYADQFGALTGKKLMTKRFKEILLSMGHLSMKEQGSRLEEIFNDWKGSNEQVDDVLVIGVRV